MPKRIQRKRTAGWRMPDGAVVVDRSSRWGNPYLLGDVLRSFPSLTVEQCQAFVVNQFRDLIRSPQLRAQHGYPSDGEIRRDLAGRDLACWCPLDQPCHADVLLEIANGSHR